ncbi:unnamed protein product [Polarella glacialis]|uniref:Uncharacterized protein n=1 Tax=Polarella glacialis TaxID=89957 RepID=A0A813I6P9_POLGL|nr:unnamed protein product [Polarella glacialis]
MAMAQSRLVLTGLASKFLLGRSPNGVQWQGMSVITLALLVFSRSYKVGGAANEFGLILVMVAVVCKVAASVYLDKVLHDDADMSVIYQSACISCGTVLPSLVYILVMDREIAILAKHWLSNIIVKRFGSVTRYVIDAAAVAGTYFLQLVLYSEKPTVARGSLCPHRAYHARCVELRKRQGMEKGRTIDLIVSVCKRRFKLECGID